MNDSSDRGRPSRRAIILIPGLRREERFLRRDILVNNLETVERHPLRRVGDVVVDGEPGLRLAYEPLRRGGDEDDPPRCGTSHVDVFEAYWADMIPEQSDMSPWAKLLNGFELVGYWVFSLRSWRAVIGSLRSGSAMIGLGLISGALTLIAWYLLLVVLVGQAVAPGGVVPPALAFPIIEDFVAAYGRAAGAVATHAWWAFVPFVLTIMQVDAIVLLARFIKDYFENKEDENGVGLRDRLRKRVTGSLRAVLAAGYDEVVVVAHSFGTVVVTDILADWPHRDDFDRLVLVSMGSPIAALRYRSTWLEGERARVLQRDGLTRWIDFFAPSDWLCGAYTGHQGRYGEAMSRRLSFEAPWPQKLAGLTHLSYYRDPQVLDCLVAPGPSKAALR